MLSIAVLFGFAACDNTTSANEDPIATIKWVDNMMGSNDDSGTRADQASTSRKGRARRTSPFQRSFMQQSISSLFP